jgi:hypothetical protein
MLSSSGGLVAEMLKQLLRAHAARQACSAAVIALTCVMKPVHHIALFHVLLSNVQVIKEHKAWKTKREEAAAKRRKREEEQAARAAAEGAAPGVPKGDAETVAVA